MDLKNKKVLVITYYWPPSSGIAVQRVIKFCKYLVTYNWEPIVLTVEGGNYPHIDNKWQEDVSHISKVFRASSIEPHFLYNKLKRIIRKREAKNNFVLQKEPDKLDKILNNIGEYIRLNLFIPDSRIGWLKNALSVARRVIQKEHPQIIFSTAPPYTAHLIALRLKKEFSIPWVADFRDPWIENIAYNKVPRLKVVKWLNRKLELNVLRRADTITCIGDSMKALIAAKLPNSEQGKVIVITNGYDPLDKNITITPSNKFYLSYFGTMYLQRFPLGFVHAIRQLVEEDRNFKRNLSLFGVGDIMPEIKNLLYSFLPRQVIELKEFVQHEEFVSLLYRTQILLLVIDKTRMNKLIITGKIFEYLPTGNPILGIGPTDGDAAKILKKTGTGVMFDYDDIEGIKQFLLEKFHEWQAGKLNKGIKYFHEFERPVLTRQLANIFNQLV